MDKVVQKILAAFLAFMLASANLLTLGTYGISYALEKTDLTKQTSSTNSANVEFNAYFEDGGHIASEEINSDTAKMIVNVKVKKAGYLKGGKVEFKDANYKIGKEFNNPNVQSIDREANTITLKQLNSGSDVTLEIPVTVLKDEVVSLDNFSKESIAQFSGKYIDGNGKENNIEKTIVNELTWKGTAEGVLETQLVKYIPYEVEGKYGVLVQAKVNTGIKESTLPIKNTKIKVEAPEINEKAPTTVNVIANNMIATNGEKSGLKFGVENYSYDEESKVVEINVSNQKDKIMWVKNVKDEYLVTFIFDGKETYDYVKENGLDVESKVTGEIEAYNSEKTVVENKATMKMQADEEIGNITDFKEVTTTQISKGQIYANYEASNKKETAYSVYYAARINSAELTDKVEFTQKIDKFVDEEETESLTTVSGKNYVYNKTVKISEEVFNKMLGEEGTIEIYNSEEKIGTINKETEKDEKGNYVLDIKKNDTNEITIKTSKPITEGEIVLEIGKGIKTQIDYSKEQVKEFVKILSEVVGNSNNTSEKVEKEIKLNETTPEVRLEINKKELSTVVKNENVEIRTILDTSSLDKALYKNPTLKITMPSYVKEVELNNYNIVMANGLKIEKAKVSTENGLKVINVELKGTQTAYTIDAEYKGTIVVLNTNIAVEKLTPTSEGKIVLNYKNENEYATKTEGKEEVKVKFVAPTGVVAANGISNYAKGKADLLSISAKDMTATLKTYEAKRTATVTGTVLNNNGNTIKDTTILGRIPVRGTEKIDKDEELNATFDAKLSSQIAVEGIKEENYTVYYSENGEATKDLNNEENGWTTKATAKSKSYLIVTEDLDMKNGDEINFAYNVAIPENLEYNNSAYETYKVYYNDVSAIGTQAETKVASTLELTTGSGPVLEAELTYDAPVVRQGQVVKMNVTVKNTGTTDATDVKVSIPTPEGAEFTANMRISGFIEDYMLMPEENLEETPKVSTKNIDLGTIKPNESKEIAYYLRINEDTNQEIVTKAEISMNEAEAKVYTNECRLNVQEGKMVLELAEWTDKSFVLTKDDVISFTLYVRNLSNSEELNNIDISIPLPEGTKAKDIVFVNDFNTEEISTEGITYDEANNIIRASIDKLEQQKNMRFSVEVLQNINNFTMKAEAKLNQSEQYYSNVSEYKVEGVTLQVSELTSTPKYVKEGEDVTYTVNIKNTSNVFIDELIVSDIIPEELEFVKATYSLENMSIEETELVDGKLNIHIARLGAGKSVKVEITAKAKLLENTNDKEIQNQVTIETQGIDAITTNIVKNTIEYNEELREEIEKNGENESGDIEDPDNPGQPSDPEDPSNPDTPTDPDKTGYKISGTAWLDSNKDGKRDESEMVLSNIDVVLLNKADNSIVKDIVSNEIKRVLTDENGKYEFTNIQEGEYIVVFLYDATRYSITQYQAKHIDESLNSDAIDMEITVNGTKVKAGITDLIKITKENARDIDIGLYENQEFDLKLDKSITKITLTTPTVGTIVYDYDYKNLTKIEVLSRNLGKSSIVIEYKIVVTNEGETAGYVKKIVDYLPKNVTFNSEINKDWYLSDNGNVYNNSLENEIINPGESKEVTLILTKTITENSLGILNNNAEIYECYNEFGIEDIDSKAGNKAESEDDMSKADIVLGVVTGKIVGYSTIAFVIIGLIGFGVFEIKKRVLNKKEE